LEDSFREKDLLDTFAAVLAAHPECRAFRGVREELATLKAATRK